MAPKKTVSHKEPCLTKDDTVFSAARAIIGVQAHRLRHNTENALRNRDPDSLHDLRVAARRLRSALRIFGPFLEKKVTRTLRGELKWVTRRLNEARNLDIFFDRIDAGLSKKNISSSARQKILHAIEEKRMAEKQAMAKVLRSRRYLLVLNGLDTLRDSLENVCPGSRKKKHSIMRASGKIMKEALKEITSWKKKTAKDASPDDLHRIRIAFKRLRYACEFFRGLYGKNVRRAIRLCIDFQDTLGDYRDSTLCGQYIQALPHNLPEAAIRILSEHEKRCAEDAHSRFEKLWNSFPAQMCAAKKAVL